MIELRSSLSAPYRAHWPIQGPQAFVNILALKSSKIDNSLSRSAVNLTCSEPGLISNSALVTNFLSTAYFAIEAARARSSEEELVQEPINPHSTFKCQSFSFAVFCISEIGVAKSVVKDPFI